MKSMKIKHDVQVLARRENLDQVLDIIREDMERVFCPAEKQIVVEICAEEIFVNIASYAYENEDGIAELAIEMEEGKLMLCFSDCGKQYNPLSREDPDTSLPEQERQIGGLGIYMVKEMMDDVWYRYEDGKNCLFMTMTW